MGIVMATLRRRFDQYTWFNATVNVVIGCGGELALLINVVLLSIRG
jgi:hypothetical protein